MTLLQPTGDVPCEAKGCTNKISTHIFGPECEAQTGQLMYLCQTHADAMLFWKSMHPNDPVDCPQHGTIGKVKDYLILKAM